MVEEKPSERYQEKKRLLASCKISNETVTRIVISFKEKDIEYLEFLFVY